MSRLAISPARRPGSIRALASLVTAAFVLLISPLLIAGPSQAADCAADPVTAQRGAEPLCDTPVGRTFVLGVDEASPGETIGFTGTGFVREAGGGQTLNLKLNDIDIVAARLVADDNGDISGEITLPGQEVFDAYAETYGAERWWIRVLVGTGREDGESDAPSASLHDEFTLKVTDDTAVDDTTTDTPDDSDSGDDSTDDTDTDTGTGGSNDTTKPTSKGTLPNTGIEDHPGLLLGLGLGVVALALFWTERRVRRVRSS